MEESCICKAGAHDFLAMLARHPLLMARVMVMAKQIFRLEQTIESMASQPVSQRLAALLLEEMAEGQTLNGGVLLPSHSQEELAKLICAWPCESARWWPPKVRTLVVSPRMPGAK